MHVLIAIIGVIGAISVWYWRVKQATHVAKEAVDAAKTVANLPRKMAFKRKTGRSGVDMLTEPQEAATALMLETARLKGDVDEQQKEVVKHHLVTDFQYAPHEADEMLIQTMWMIQELDSSEKLVNRAAKIITSATYVSYQNRVELIEMMKNVGGVGAPLNQHQSRIISLTVQKLKIDIH